MRSCLLSASISPTGFRRKQVEEAVSTLEVKIKRRYPEVTRIFIEVQSKRRHEQFAAEEDEAPA